ncbi:MAG: hypothetical protein ABW220_07990, partial [Burkholderiaceae bacterium]
PLLDAAIALADVLRERGDQALVLDDLHLCDDESLAFLSDLLNVSNERLPWCGFVLAYRPMRARRRLRALCEKLAATGRLKLIQPGALTQASTAALMSEASRDAAQESGTVQAAVVEDILRLGGGTPALTLGLIETWTEQGCGAVLETSPSPAMRALLLERLRSCSSSAEGLARLASVAGESFSVRLAGSITGMSSWRVAEKWNELLLAGVFDARGFAFPLMEAAVYESVPETVRQFMHGEVAAALEVQGAPAAALALHYRRAGDLPRAVQLARHAAALGIAKGDASGAVAALELVLLEPDGGLTAALQDAQLPAAQQAGALYLELGRHEALGALMNVASAASDGAVDRGVCAVLCARAMAAMSQWPSAHRALVGALPLLEEAPGLLLQARTWATLAARQAGGAEPLTAVALDEALRVVPGWSEDAITLQTPRDWAACRDALRLAPG